MNTDEHNKIMNELSDLRSLRAEFMRNVMRDFDKNHHIKISDLQSKCEKIGHVRGKF
jgi:hypothetical protein